MFENCIIYLMGFAGVGKRTIATEICNQADFRLIDNHTINNVVFPFVHVDSQTKLPQEIWQKTGKVRDIALETLIEIGSRDFNYVFTNQLMDSDPSDLIIYNKIEEAAQKIDACFLPVRIICEAEEHRKRIANPDREKHLKMTRAGYIDELVNETVFTPSHKNTLTLDVSNLTFETAAQEILKELSSLHQT